MNKIYSPELDETLYRHIHKSGLEIYALPKKGYSKSYAIFATKYGSTDVKFRDFKTGKIVEIPDGVAHFLEHKMFEQPGGGNAFDEFSKTGASANAFTSFNMTAYLFSCTTNFYENLETLISFVQTPYFTEENISKEQGIIGQEIRMYRDDPGWRVYFGAIESMYNDCPVRRDIAGSDQSIGTITEELLYTCYRNFYHPSNMVLVCVGDVDFDKVFSTADKTISGEFKALPEIERFKPAESPEINIKKNITNLPVSQPIFYIGFKDTVTKPQGLLKTDIMDEIICECLFGPSSDLYRRLYEEGLVLGELSYEAENEPDYAHVLVGGESPDPEAVYDIILEEITRISEEGLDKEAFLRMKKVFYGDFVRGFNSPEGIAHSLVSYLFKGFKLFDYIGVFNSVTYEDTTEHMKAVFNKKNMVLSVVRSES